MPRSNAVLDNFNRASIGTNWTGQPLNDSAQILTIQSSVAVGGSGYDYAWWNVSQFSDQTNSGIEAAILISTLPATSGSFWLSFFQQPSAASSTADGYEFAVNILSGNDQAQIFRYLDSIATTLSDTTPAIEWATSDICIVRRSNTGLLSLIRDRAGVETVVASVDDDTYTGNFFAGGGYFDGAGTVRLDDFSAGNFTVAGAIPPSLTMAPKRAVLL